MNQDGKFLYVLDPEKDANRIVNGASFNYANGNSQQHQALDVHYGENAPEFRTEIIENQGEEYKAPNNDKKYQSGLKKEIRKRKTAFEDKVND